MQVSYSRVSTHKKCPYQYFLRYNEKFKTIPTDDPQSALILGHALHTGIEKDVQAAINEYFGAYPIITDFHIDEAIKLEYLIPKVKAILPKGEHEVKIEDEDFIGYIDLLAPMGWMSKNAIHNPYGEDVDVYDLYDFKYSNNVSNYMKSEQLHLYKYYFEKLNPGKRIRNLYFVFIPKVQIKRKKNETDFEFRQRIISELDAKEIKTVEVNYDPNKVIEFLTDTKHLVEAEEFDKKPMRLCDWCDYQNYCQKGDDTMILPKNERRSIETINKKVIWLYGAPFSGKTYLANKFPDPLMLNTDGNIRFIDAPYISIKDVVTVEGRMTKRTFAWEVFKDAIAELEKKQNDFKTLVVDLLEDTYESCRLYMYDQLNITHESDDSFRAWDKVRTEFLSTLKRLMNLDYENIILISHEDTSKDITKKGGDKVTAIKPNINDKCANKVAGMVDIVARVIADGDNRVLSFKTNEVIFGGGRLNVTAKEIPLDYDELMKVYDEANIGHGEKRPARTATKVEQTALPKCPIGDEVFNSNDLCSRIDAGHHCHQEEGPDNCERANGSEDTPVEEQPTRKRRTRNAVEEAPTEETVAEQPVEAPAEEAPVRRRRRRVE